LNAPPQSITESQATVKGSNTRPNCEEDEEDLDEDRRVPDHLDVHGRELAHDRDPVGTSGAENGADEEGADDRDRGHIERAAERGREFVGVVLDERPQLEGDGEHSVRNQERPYAVRPLLTLERATARSQHLVVGSPPAA
jgi:hypothetical protein